MTDVGQNKTNHLPRLHPFITPALLFIDITKDVVRLYPLRCTAALEFLRPCSSSHSFRWQGGLRLTPLALLPKR